MKKNIKNILCYTLLGVMTIISNQIYAQSENNIDELLEMATNNDLNAQLELGKNYKYGNEVGVDLKKAFYWFLKAAEQNNEEAGLEVAIMYSSGQGTPQNPTEAFKWLNKFPNNDNSVLAMGYCYLYGFGTAINYKLALFNYQKSYNKVKTIPSMEGLIHIYKNGLGVPVNTDKVALLEAEIKAEKNIIAQKEARLAGHENKKTECDKILNEIKEEEANIAIENEEINKSQIHIDYLQKSIEEYVTTLKKEYGAYTDGKGVLVLQQINDVRDSRYWDYRDILANRQQAVKNLNYAISNHNNRIDLKNDRFIKLQKKADDYNKDCR